LPIFLQGSDELQVLQVLQVLQPGVEQAYMCGEAVGD
jgi:hypothetical protein